MEEAGSASSGGVENWWEPDSTSGNLLVNDGKYNIATAAPFQARGSSFTTQSYTSINVAMLHSFVAPKTGNLSKITIYVSTTTDAGSCELQVGIYDSSDGFVGDLVGMAVFPNSIKSTANSHSQTSFVDTSGSSTTISLTKGKLYYFGVLPKSSTNSSGDVGDGFTLRASNFRESLNQSGKSSSYSGLPNPSFMAFSFTGLASSASNFTWIQLSGQNKPYVIIEY